MKQQKGFNWFKFVTISMVAIGVGFFLLSLILPKYIWRDEHLDFGTLDDYQKSPIPPQVAKNAVTHNEGSEVTLDSWDDASQIDEMLAWLESLESQDEDSTTDPQETLMESLDALEGDIDEIHGEEANIPPSQEQVSEVEIARLREEIEETADQYWNILMERKEILTTSYFPHNPDQLMEEYLNVKDETVSLLLLYFGYTKNVDEFNPGGEINTLFSGMVELSAEGDTLAFDFTEEVVYGSPR